MGFVGCIPRFLKQHAGWILAGLGISGLVGTSVLTAKEAPIAKEALWKAAADKTAETFPEKDISEIYVMIDDGKLDPLKLTLWEKIKTVAPIYAPAVLTGTATAGCIVGCQLVNLKQQSVILAAYGTLAMQFDQYRQAIRTEYGDEADKKALVMSRLEVQRLKDELIKLREENGPFMYGIATLPGIIFEARPLDVQEAFSHWNRNLVLGGENCLTELYQMIGIPESCYNPEESDEYGWNEYENEVDWGCGYVDFTIMNVESAIGPIRMICMPTPPYKLNVDYGFQGDSTEHIYPGHDPEKAIMYAHDIGQSEVIRIDHPRITYANLSGVFDGNGEKL